MNFSELNCSQSGQNSMSDMNIENSLQEKEIKSSDTQDGMKRAAAQQLIGQYFYQLTEGCGNENCTNVNCASSNLFRFQAATKNQLALQAISLSKNKAELCDQSPSKLSRYPTEGDDGATASTAQSVSSAEVLETGCSKQISPMVSYFTVQSDEENVANAKEVEFLTLEKVNHIVEECEQLKQWSKLIRLIGEVFNNPESLKLSFRKESEEKIEDSTSPTATDTYIEFAASSSPSKSNECFLSNSVDLNSVRRTFQKLTNIPHHPYQPALINALDMLAKTIEMEAKRTKMLNVQDYVRIFLIVMEIPMLHYPEYLESAFPSICRALGAMPVKLQAQMAREWSTFSKVRLQELVQSLQQMITVKVINNEGRWSSTFRISDDPAITSATRVLKILYYASMIGGKMDSASLIEEEKQLNKAELVQDQLSNSFGFDLKEPSTSKEDPLGKELDVDTINCREPLIPFEEFVNEPLNDSLDIGLDYSNYRIDPENKFSFVHYSFILTTASKHMSMYYDNRIRMLHERRSALVQTFWHGGPPNPFLRVRVRRDHIIDDALVNLEMIAMENPGDLRKQLFVEFDGEQGLDEGGVSKEFFQLIVEELFNPDIGMFTYKDESGHFWINPLSFENEAQFILIGIILGLAIYNSCILDIHFPMVIYRKLMGKKGVFSDLQEVDPTLYNSLNDMLKYESEDFEDVFEQTFQISYHDVFGNLLTHNLKENGDSIVVTFDNRQEFVDLYADFLLNKSIDSQFCSFKRGFLMATSESPLKQLFRPEELEVLVCGSKILDFHVLEEATDYDGGFTAESETIKNFWTIVHEMSEDDKKKLLQFTTGTDRVPVGGLSKLKMIIARNGPDSDRLPTSHTCFNVLLLPEYPTLEKLRDRLMKAINYAKGFGML